MPLLLTLLALLGFGGPGRGSPGEAGQLPEPVPAPAPLLLRVDLPDLAPQGMNVPFTVALANRGEATVQVELGGRPIAFDVVIRDRSGRLVWRRLEGVPVEMILVTHTLGPGDVLAFQERWDQRDAAGRQVPPGVYRIRAILPVTGVPGGWGSVERELTITP